METMAESISMAEAKPAGVPGAGGDALGERDLAELLGAFNEVTSKLQVAHESLRAEVVRLQGELRQANEQIERSRRLAALGEMAAGIAHEVRNPLGSIRLYAKMLVDDLGTGGDRVKERGIAEKIGAATRGLDAVVTDVLAFAREMRVVTEPVEAGALLTRAIDECLAADRADGHGGPIRVIREDREGGTDGEVVVCDAALVHRALVNVVRNAIQAMREPGVAGCELRVGVERLTLPGSDGEAETFVAIVVRDSGPGIPEGVMERMFNPFFTTRATGTGLGLGIVHRIMDAHGGRVRVRNAEEGGAIVELLIPDRGMDSKC
ncbi:MAG TPA: ATP-binding protein [Phycisphaerales bacterium]|nr:ATP-binding protein [Phycisphaerales bacterium]